MADAVAVLVAGGMPRFDVFSEVFTATTEIRANSMPADVTMARSGRVSRGRPPRERAGCRGRGRHPAAERLPDWTMRELQPELEAGQVAHLSAYDGPADHCLTCRAVPLSDLVLDA